jgi:hypothetical protein
MLVNIKIRDFFKTIGMIAILTSGFFTQNNLREFYNYNEYHKIVYVWSLTPYIFGLILFCISKKEDRTLALYSMAGILCIDFFFYELVSLESNGPFLWFACVFISSIDNLILLIVMILIDINKI